MFKNYECSSYLQVEFRNHCARKYFWDTAIWNVTNATTNVTYLCNVCVTVCTLVNAHCKNIRMFRKIGDRWVWFTVTVATLQERISKNIDCSTNCERCSLKVMNVLQNVRGTLWKWLMFYIWDALRGRGSACVSQGPAVVNQAFAAWAKKPSRAHVGRNT